MGARDRAGRSVQDKIETQEQEQEQTLEEPKYEGPASLDERVTELSLTQQQLVESHNRVEMLIEGLEEKLTDFGQTVIDQKIVKLQSGREVSSREMDGYAIAAKTQSKIEGMTSGFDGLAKTVNAKHTINVDSDKIAELIDQRLNGRIDRIVEARNKHFEETLRSQETRVEALGDEKVSQATRRLELAAEALESFNGARSGWVLGRFAMALLPLAITSAVIALALGVVGYVFGVGPLYGWAWDSFRAADAVSHKALIAVGTFASTVLALLTAVWGGKKIYKYYDSW